MCGITGYYSKSFSAQEDIILKMNSAISHRGPDMNGIWQNKNAGISLGHQRLSIIDLSKLGQQPMKSFSNRYILTYNGEIYNYLEIKKELELINSNVEWRGSSDTEVLLEAIEYWGIEATLKKIIGMFAFAVWDNKTHSLTLARDRMGEKPIYFGWQGSGTDKVFLFGSELKALKVHPRFIKDINRDAIVLQLKYGYIPSPHSIYKNIYKLLPGHYLQLSENDLQRNLLPIPKPYWSLLDVAVYGVDNPLTLSEKEIKVELEQLLLSSVKQQMVSEVPLGAFLSGGVDSSTIVAMMQIQSSKQIKTFSIGFDDYNYDEARYAKKVANHLRTDHTELYISDKHAMMTITKLPFLYDEPFSDSSQIPTILVSELAKKKVTVSLSGDGGDELFCGYNRYTMSKNLWSKINLIPIFIRKILASGIKLVPHQSWNKLSNYSLSLKKYQNFGDKIHKGADVLDSKNLLDLYSRIISFWRDENEVVINGKRPKTVLDNTSLKISSLDSQQQMMLLDSLTYLPDDILVKIDRAAMGSSLETRVPFLNHKLIEYVWKIPQSLKLRNGESKWILREILYQHVPKKLIEKPKMGFEVPLGAWLRGPLKHWAENLLNETRLQREGYLNPKLIHTKWNEHLSGKRNWEYDLWNVLMFQAWLELNN
jgi:asparagine synthase (glutamine-hydrolysing)